MHDHNRHRKARRNDLEEDDHRDHHDNLHGVEDTPLGEGRARPEVEENDIFLCHNNHHEVETDDDTHRDGGCIHVEELHDDHNIHRPEDRNLHGEEVIGIFRGDSEGLLLAPISQSESCYSS